MDPRRRDVLVENIDTLVDGRRLHQLVHFSKELVQSWFFADNSLCPNWAEMDVTSGIDGQCHLSRGHHIHAGDKSILQPFEYTQHYQDTVNSFIVD